MAKKQKKMPRPKAQAARGFQDNFGGEVLARQDMLQKLGQLYYQFGFDPLETSGVETVEALGKFLPDVDRPNEGVFAWQDEDETWLALRYDLTAPLARVAAQYRNDLPSPYRRYAMGPVWRNEKPGLGRFRQFYQCDADTVGTPSIAADAEMAMLMARALEHLGIARGDYVVNVNNRKVLSGVMEAAGIYDPSDPSLHEGERGVALRAIDKFDKFGADGVKALLGEGRLDDSGDFTKGAGLAEEQIARLIGFVEAGTGPIALSNLNALVGTSATGQAGLAELEQIAELAAADGFGSEQIKINPAVVRGLGYYTGPVFEAELTFDIVDEKGRVRSFGSVAGGGRYDDLVKRFTGQAVPATGMSIGVDRLLAALKAKGLSGNEPDSGPILVTIMDKDQLPRYQSMVSELREAGLRAELYLGNPKDLGKQLKYADARRSPLAIIEGSAERDAGKLVIKDLVLGAKLSQEIESREEWAQNPSQEEIARDALVSYVKGKLS